MYEQPKVNVIYDDTVIDALVTSISWSGDMQQAARKLDVSLTNTQDGLTRIMDFEEGREIRLVMQDDGAELFRGVVFTQYLNLRGQQTITAYDENVYLAKNNDSRRVVKTTASEVVRQLCEEFGIEYTDLPDTGYVIPRMIFNEATLWDIIQTVLTETRAQTGRRYFVYSRGGILRMSERKELVSTLVIEVGANLLDATYWRSIEDMRNRVKVIGGEDKKPITVTAGDQALIDRFGLMQHVERADADLKRSQLEQRAEQLLAKMGVIDDEATVTALGDVGITAGGAVYVIEPMTGIVGAYYVSADSHTFENGMHQMTLTLTATDDLPTLEYTGGDDE